MMYEGLTPSPDHGFVKKLHQFDPTLEVTFDRFVGKFIITQPRKTKPGERTAAIVIDDAIPADRTWRQPDERDLCALKAADFETKGHKDRIREGEEYMAGHKAKQDKDIDETFRLASRDDKIQIRNSYSEMMNEGKPHSQFARIVPKSKGKPFKMTDRRRVA